MNNVKAKLLNAASKQEIHDNSLEIIKKVDTSKVIVAPEKQRKRRFSFVPLSFVGAACAVIALFTGVALYTVKDKKTTNNSSSLADSTLVIDDEFITETYVQEVCTLVNIAQSIETLTYDNVEIDTTSKRLTNSEEQALVNDVNMCVKNIEGMLGDIERINGKVVENKNAAYSYKYDMEISISNFEYHLYYDESIIEEKNVGQDNYKCNAVINGLVVTSTNDYSFTGSKIIKNGVLEYATRLIINENEYIILNERYSSSENEYTYEYFKNNESLKYIHMEQEMTEDGKTKEIKFNNKWDKTVIKSGQDNYIDIKIKGRDGDYLYIDIVGTTYKYTFKNSEHEFFKNIK